MRVSSFEYFIILAFNFTLESAYVICDNDFNMYQCAPKRLTVIHKFYSFKVHPEYGDSIGRNLIGLKAKSIAADTGTHQ